MMDGGSRSSRQAAILELLRTRPVQTQAQLAEELRRLRIEATQATISRDLRQLGVARVAAAEGPRYLAPRAEQESRARLETLLAAQLSGLEVVGNILVLHTPVGAAQGVAAAVDELALGGVAGTVAGDDTVFVLARSRAQARSAQLWLAQARDRGRRWA